MSQFLTEQTVRYALARPAPLRLGILLLATIVAAVGCSKRSTAPPLLPPSTTAPAAATTGPATYRLTATTTLGRSEKDGQWVYESIEPGTVVDVIQAGPQWCRVRKPGGPEGWVPTARLDPRITSDISGNSVPTSAPAAPVFDFLAGAQTPAVPELPANRATTTPDSQNSSDGFPGGVSSAINRAGKYLVSLRQNDNWESVPAPLPGENGFNGARRGQLTAIATYAQFLSGELPDLSGPVNWLRNAPMSATATVALRDQVLALVPGTKYEPRNRALMTVVYHDVKVLVESSISMSPAGEVLPIHDVNATCRNLADLEQAGGETPLKYWTALEQASCRVQNPDGSWGAAGAPSVGRADTTAAGALARVLIREKLPLPRAGLDCHDPPSTDTSLLRAMDWLDGHAVDAIGDPAAMWAVEQAVLATGRKYVGSEDWYRAGAEYLLKTQQSDGSWPAPPGADPAGRRIPETAYAMLFLSHGSCPLIINKLDYESAPDAKTGARHFGPAQHRQRDVAHFADWAGKTLCVGRPLNWQWVNFSMTPADFQEAPVLYITGSEALDFTPAQIDMLRNYALRGGLIVGNAYCASVAFIKSFCNIGSLQLFPLYTFRPLPPDHPLLSNEMFRASKWHGTPRPRILGLGNGVRELMLIPDADLSRAWQLDAQMSHRDEFQLGMDILMYASHLDDWPVRGASRLVTRDPKILPTRVLHIARVNAGTNLDPEPGGWVRWPSSCITSSQPTWTCKMLSRMPTPSPGQSPHST